MDRDLLLAILSMDTYHRGYNSGLQGKLKKLLDASDQIGPAKIGRQPVEAAASEIGFYARAYSLGTETIVAYRGTDNGISNLTGKDQLYGFPLGVGVSDTAQGLMAVEFYRQIVDAIGGGDPRTANITVTGHSLGGALLCTCHPHSRFAAKNAFSSAAASGSAMPG